MGFAESFKTEMKSRNFSIYGQWLVELSSVFFSLKERRTHARGAAGDAGRCGNAALL
ncbi:hypothetical protein K504DRAFT_464442 [Pleomassaria siparia CBS 279.74]|uniref:Uncharacterized protein n=1 Tax=Pleomassaria siparia CBS 279.74 TaxID=1314801 RepID=A0A6G1KIP5_9PLEO|nr:hypothetical protein K504DRAFT_464442 [Pleomassaria siparia CBS 279.74]